MKRVLLAGITGQLGSYIARELHRRGYVIRAVVRNPEKLKRSGIEPEELLQAEVTEPDSIRGCCRDIDAVITTIGITRQRDGLTYMDVDYQANLNLLRAAKASGVKRFIYVSVLNGKDLRHLKICDAKEKFVEQLEKSELDYCILRPNGFFSDMNEFYTMAKKGRIYLFGSGKMRMNPIHVADLANVCVDAVEHPDREVTVGGPQILTHNEIAAIAFEALGGKPRVVHIPDWVRATILRMARALTGPKVYGPIEFFLTVMATDMLAPEYGKRTLKEYFTNLNGVNA